MQKTNTKHNATNLAQLLLEREHSALNTVWNQSMKSLTSTWLFALALIFGLPITASASTATFLGSGVGPGGVSVSASAVFNITGDTLTITLTNTSSSNSGQDVPGSTLTGLFWNSASSRTLTPVSALVAPGSSIIQGASATNVGGEFGYQAAGFQVGAPAGANRGIASSGYLSTGLPGDLGNFNGTNLHGPVSLDGINFGIVSSASGFNPNGGLASVPLIQNSVVFVLTGVSGLTTSDISNVSFQYGTAFSELNVPGGGGKVPEPGSVALVGSALLGLYLTRRRILTAKSTLRRKIR